MKFNLNNLSQYRGQLMGIATLMIIFCHINVYIPNLPSYIAKPLTYGNYGVDVFLLLSGIGLSYSLAKCKNLKDWYLKRYKRILVPYILIQVPFWTYYIVTGQFDFIDNLKVLSTIEFWLSHRGAWFIALLIPLYLVTPILYRVSNCKAKWYIVTLMIAVLVFSSKYATIHKGDFDNILYNVIFAAKRCACFFVGLAITPYVKDKKSMNTLLLMAAPVVCYLLLHHIFEVYFWEWLVILPFCCIVCIMMKFVAFRKVNVIFSWLGEISLESYLANIYMCGAIKNLASRYDIGNQYVQYAIVIVIGIAIAYMTNRISNHLIKHV